MCVCVCVCVCVYASQEGSEEVSAGGRHWKTLAQQRTRGDDPREEGGRRRGGTDSTESAGSVSLKGVEFYQYPLETIVSNGTFWGTGGIQL